MLQSKASVNTSGKRILIPLVKEISLEASCDKTRANVFAPVIT